MLFENKDELAMAANGAILGSFRDQGFPDDYTSYRIQRTLRLVGFASSESMKAALNDSDITAEVAVLSGFYEKDAVDASHGRVFRLLGEAGIHGEHYTIAMKLGKQAAMELAEPMLDFVYNPTA